VASEPGQGHSTSAESIEHIKKYSVTEKDMPREKASSVPPFEGNQISRRSNDFSKKYDILFRKPGT